MRKILIVEDESDNVEVIKLMLQKSYEPLVAYNGRDAIQLAVREHPSLILLDIKMPEMDGFEVCKRLREQPATRKIPIIFLTGFTHIDEKIRGFTVGADDYLPKPFDERELLARIQARLRVFEDSPLTSEKLEFGSITIRPASFQTWIKGQEVKLTKVEFELLQYFLEKPEIVIDRSRLLADLWPDTIVSNRTVDTHIANLRKKLKETNFPLETIYGAGYILKKSH